VDIARRQDGLRANLPGWGLISFVAVFCFYIAPQINSLYFFEAYMPLADFILAIIVGLIIKNIVGVAGLFEPGLRHSTILTKTGIVVMGTKYSLASLAAVGGQAIIMILLFLVTSAYAIWWFAKRFNNPTSLSALLAAGLSICGVSATIAIAPAVKAKNEEMAYTIAIVLAFGLGALLVFPMVGHMFELTPEEFGAFAGIGIINSAQVIAAGLSYGPEAGAIAGIYNIGRVLFLPFVVLMLVLLAINAEGGDTSQVSKREIILEKFPIFVLGFIGVVAVNSLGVIDAPTVQASNYIMEWCFLLGFASIGLTTSLSDIKAAGVSGMVLGFLLAGTKAVLALIAAMTLI